ARVIGIPFPGPENLSGFLVERDGPLDADQSGGSPHTHFRGRRRTLPWHHHVKVGDEYPSSGDSGTGVPGVNGCAPLHFEPAGGERFQNSRFFVLAASPFATPLRPVVGERGNDKYYGEEGRSRTQKSHSDWFDGSAL